MGHSISCEGDKKSYHICRLRPTGCRCRYYLGKIP
eukprot:IDg20583t1